MGHRSIPQFTSSPFIPLNSLPISNPVNRPFHLIYATHSACWVRSHSVERQWLPLHKVILARVMWMCLTPVQQWNRKGQQNSILLKTHLHDIQKLASWLQLRLCNIQYPTCEGVPFLWQSHGRTLVEHQHPSGKCPYACIQNRGKGNSILTRGYCI